MCEPDDIIEVQKWLESVWNEPKDCKCRQKNDLKKSFSNESIQSVSSNYRSSITEQFNGGRKAVNLVKHSSA